MPRYLVGLEAPYGEDYNVITVTDDHEGFGPDVLTTLMGVRVPIIEIEAGSPICAALSYLDKLPLPICRAIDHILINMPKYTDEYVKSDGVGREWEKLA